MGAIVVFVKDVGDVFLPEGERAPLCFLKDFFHKRRVRDPTAQIQSILPIASGDAFADHRPLRTAARMEAQTGVVFAHTALNEDIVGLLEADAVAVVVPHGAILNDGAEAAIEKNAGASTAVQIDIF